MTVDEKEKLAIVGTAGAMSEVFSFVTTLDNSGYFSEVTASNTANRKEGTKDVADFEISAQFVPKGKAKVPAASLPPKVKVMAEVAPHE